MSLRVLPVPAASIAPSARWRNSWYVGVRVALTLALLALAACPVVDNPHRVYPEPDYDDFVVEIQPMLTAQCASNGCHGSPDRPLTLYAVGYLRAEPEFPETPLWEHELTAGELAWNYDALRIRMLGAAEADDAKLLLKCLDPAIGGISHAGDLVIFETRDHPEYVKLRDWIEGGL